ncbi:adenyl-nucleotide exchange factor sse1 [Tulasnella sp. JGI-2019a]|nr:adenyl-nucleotide exchange factor sse1 [Tulasnella sp. JGI-2019a]KAG9010352.1 adenyl-nucleotide exchange factor sse1 [Tulasnella sp. JGI-2019a]KAG9038644.1 adenyl-nucleotide exchange factor sse1 [Tulasnella sp. JGI-2019a]
MASVVGIDFGNLASKIGVARQRGIDVITNEVSNRATPSLISFGVKQRAIGEAAKNLESSNFKNTVGSLKRIVGRSLNDKDITDYESKYINAKMVDVHGSVGVEVNYVGERHTFSATQLVAAYLGKLRDIASRELKQGVSDVVISVPGWFTEAQRRAVLDAAYISGLNPLRLINDTTAIALGYGITKSDLPPPETPRYVVFVDIGHSNYSVAVVAFSAGQFHVKSTAYDRHFGGRDLDMALVEHFAAEFKEKYKIDVMSNPKARFRLLSQVERLKKILSANAEGVLSVESIMNDIDVSSRLTKDQFEALPPVADVLSRVTRPLQEALELAGIGIEEIHSVELVGGSTRVPAIKDRLQAFFGGKTLSTTLNQDEAICRGATFACAMLSPVFRVREFNMHDITHYPVRVQWERSEDDPDEDTELLVFDRGNSTPSTKILTFYRSGPFEVEARYNDPSSLPGSINPWIAKITVKDVMNTGEGPSQVKVKTRVSHNGLVSFEGAQVILEAPPSQEEMDVEGEAKKKVVKKDVPFVTSNLSMDKSLVNNLREIENSMYESDKLVQDTEDRKNALEEYVYDMRSKVDARLAPYVQPEEKSSLLSALQAAEDWLYTEEGEDATKSAYVERLDKLHAIGVPISNRYMEAENRPKAMSELRQAINAFLSQAQSDDEKYNHIDSKDKQAVIERAATAQKWMDDNAAKQAERPKNVPPVFLCEEVRKKAEDLTYFATPIFNKPKPKPKVETPVPGATPNPSGRGTPNPPPPPSGTQTPQEGAHPPAPEPPEMDID